MKKLLFILLVTVCFQLVNAQTKPMAVVSKVEKLSGKTVVQIKWFVGDFNAFKALLENGSTVERIEITANQDPATANYTNAVTTVITPAKTRLDKLDANLESTQKINSLLEPFMSKNEQNEETKNFALALAVLECSISKEMGIVVGSTLTDNSVEKGKTYAYRITIKDTPNGYLVVHTDELTEYPKIESFALKLDRKNTVELTWQARNTKAFGYGFQLEKSLDKPQEGTYLTQTPYVPVRSADEKADKDDSFRDEQLIEGRTHYYRLVGLNYFGEAVLFSDWKKIYVPNHVHAELYIDTTFAKGESRIINGSAFGSGKPMNIERYELHQSTKKDADYSKIASMSFTDSVFSFTVTMPKTGDQFYYKVLAISKDNDTVSSLPSYVFTLDQEAPEKPTGLTGAIDSLGVVRIEWQAPKDKDLQGYRIFRANDKREDFTERNTVLSTSTSFTDTMRLDNLTSEVYYCLKAVDLNYNNSPFSDTILIIKPDTIAPVAYVLLKPEIKDTTLTLQWIASPSTDIQINYLIRQMGTKRDTVTRWSDANVAEKPVFVDQQLIAGTAYSYHIVTVDKSGNTSESQPRNVYFEPGYRRAIKTANAVMNLETKAIDLSWSLPEGEVFSFQIYKATNDGELSLLKTIENGSCVSFSDRNVKLGFKYTYTVKYILQTGIHGMPTTRLVVVL